VLLLLSLLSLLLLLLLPLFLLAALWSLLVYFPDEIIHRGNFK
jgi:hypothetical protein